MSVQTSIIFPPYSYKNIVHTLEMVAKTKDRKNVDQTVQDHEVSYSDKIITYPEDMSKLPSICDKIQCAFLFIEKGSLSEESMINHMKKAQRQFNNKMTKFIVIDGLCYLEQI